LKRRSWCSRSPTTCGSERGEAAVVEGAARALSLVGVFVGWPWVYNTLVVEELFPALGKQRTSGQLHTMAVLFGHLGMVRGWLAAGVQVTSRAPGPQKLTGLVSLSTLPIRCRF
jgi:hypothetical protein